MIFLLKAVFVLAAAAVVIAAHCVTREPEGPPEEPPPPDAEEWPEVRYELTVTGRLLSRAVRPRSPEDN